MVIREYLIQYTIKCKIIIVGRRQSIMLSKILEISRYFIENSNKKISSCDAIENAVIIKGGQ